jgi:hypothetical protein
MIPFRVRFGTIAALRACSQLVLQLGHKEVTGPLTLVPTAILLEAFER